MLQTLKTLFNFTNVFLALTAGVTFASAQEPTPPMKPLTRSEAWSVFGYDPAADFRAYDPQYRAKINKYKDALEQLRQDMFRQAKAGRKTPCARQIYVEAQWRVHYTADFDRIEKRVQALRDLLNQPADPPGAQGTIVCGWQFQSL